VVINDFNLMRAAESVFDIVKYTLENDLAFRGAALRELAGHPALLTKAAGYDVDPELLNFSNGFLDLRTMTFTPHDTPHGKLFRMGVGFPYDPFAKCSRWQQYLEEAHPGDGNLPPEERIIDYLKYASGTAAIGRQPPFRAGFWIFGITSTGKSVFSNTVRTALGDYASVLHPGLLMRARGADRMECALADLEKKRLVCLNELPDGQVDARLFKVITSSDGDQVRGNYQNAKTVKYTHTLLTTTNHRPVIDDAGGAVFARLRPIGFMQQVAVPDNDLEQKLLAEVSGILNWIVEAAHRILIDPNLYRVPPKSVRNGVEAYRSEMNVIGSFVSECCNEGAPLSTVTSTDSLFDVFKVWCQRHNQLSRISRRRFLNMLEEAGFKAKRYGSVGGKRIRGIAGICINNEYSSLLYARERLSVEAAAHCEEIPGLTS